MTITTGTQSNEFEAADSRFFNAADLQPHSFDAVIERAGALIDEFVCSRVDMYEGLEQTRPINEEARRDIASRKNDIESLLRSRAGDVAGVLEQGLGIGDFTIGSNQYVVMEDSQKITHPKTRLLFIDEADVYSFCDIAGTGKSSHIKRTGTEHHIQLIEDVARQLTTRTQ